MCDENLEKTQESLIILESIFKAAIFFLREFSSIPSFLQEIRKSPLFLINTDSIRGLSIRLIIKSYKLVSGRSESSNKFSIKLRVKIFDSIKILIEDTSSVAE